MINCILFYYIKIIKEEHILKNGKQIGKSYLIINHGWNILKKIKLI
jgi:hypothetical protein